MASIFESPVAYYCQFYDIIIPNFRSPCNVRFRSHFYPFYAMYYYHSLGCQLRYSILMFVSFINFCLFWMMESNLLRAISRKMLIKPKEKKCTGTAILLYVLSIPSVTWQLRSYLSGYSYQTLQGLFFNDLLMKRSLKNTPWRVWYEYPDNGKCKELEYFWKNNVLLLALCTMVVFDSSNDMVLLLAQKLCLLL